MRIITGLAKGCNLKTPKGMSTRPTSDRVKESLFSILGSDACGRVLDIFAGTGGLGLEALSRGADSCTFIDKATTEIIADNAKHTRLADKCQILKGDVFAQLFDLVFCDPPYHQGLAHRALEQLENSQLLAPDAIVVMEYGGDEPELPATTRLQMVKNQQYGKTTQINFYHLPVEEG